ncbi:MAG TPA: hypothetical protein VMU38_08735 [Candidatus Binatia bacterium]|nr:hypothetical protein [Candidatus Binatia bacterium]
MKYRSLLLAALALAVVAAASPVRAADPSVTVTLAEQNGSGESGTATLTQSAAGVTVVLVLTGAPATTPQPAHVHNGTCADLKDPVYPLTSAVAGKSTTTIKGVTIAQLLKGPFAINVHASATDLGKYVACGNIAAPTSM